MFVLSNCVCVLSVRSVPKSKMKQVIVGGVLFLLLVQASIVLCQIRMRPSQLKLSAINYPDVQVERDPREYKGQEQQESSEKKETKPMKVPAFVVTKIDEGICK